MGITTEDFMVKPVRVSELLDWLGRKLQLTWLEAQPVAPQVLKAGVPPSRSALRSLQEQVDAGYMRGVHKTLDQLLLNEPQCESFVQEMREMAKQFQIDAMANRVRRLLAADAAGAEGDAS